MAADPRIDDRAAYPIGIARLVDHQNLTQCRVQQCEIADGIHIVEEQRPILGLFQRGQLLQQERQVGIRWQMMLVLAQTQPVLPEPAPFARLAGAAGVAVARLERALRRRPQDCLLYTSPSPRDQRGSRMPSSA